MFFQTKLFFILSRTSKTLYNIKPARTLIHTHTGFDKKTAKGTWLTIALKSFGPRMRPMNLSALSQADPHRFNADRKPHHVVSLTFKEDVNDPTPLDALGETSQPEGQPHCLRWGTRSGLARGNERLLCEAHKDKPSPPFPGFSFQAIAKADLWTSLYKCRQGARGPEWPSDYWGGGAGTMLRKFSQVCFTLVKAQPRHHKLWIVITTCPFRHCCGIRSKTFSNFTVVFLQDKLREFLLKLWNVLNAHSVTVPGAWTARTTKDSPCQPASWLVSVAATKLASYNKMTLFACIHPADITLQLKGW